MQADGKKNKEAKEFMSERQLWILLACVSVIGILAALLLPVTSGPDRRYNKETAMATMSHVEAAIYAYQTEYGKMPTGYESSLDRRSDFTFGTAGTGSESRVQNPGDGYQANNSEVMAVLMAFTTFRNGQATVNRDHRRNPKRIVFLEAKLTQGSRSPGIGDDGVYRDPWGNPYIITLDVNGDGFCEDPLYGKVRQKVFVWSFGPDARADLSLKPGEGVNQDNITTER